MIIHISPILYCMEFKAGSEAYNNSDTKIEYMHRLSES